MRLQQINHGIFISISNSGTAFGKDRIPGASASAIRLCDHFRSSCMNPATSTFETLLLDEPGEGSRSNIISHIVRYLSSIPDTCDTFVIYIIAHGKYRGGLTILAEDSLPEVYEDTGISLNWLYEKIAVATAKKKAGCLLLLDCCIESFRTTFSERMPKSIDLLVASSPKRPFTSSKSSTGSLFSSSLLKVLSSGNSAVMTTNNSLPAIDVVREVARTSPVVPSFFAASGREIALPINSTEFRDNSESRYLIRFLAREMPYDQNSTILRFLQPTVSKILSAYELPEHMDEFGEILPLVAGRIQLLLPEGSPKSVILSFLNSLVFQTEDVFSELEVLDPKRNGVALRLAKEAFSLTLENEQPTPLCVLKEGKITQLKIWVDESVFRVSCQRRQGLSPAGFLEFREQLLSVCRAITTVGKIN